MFLMYKNGVRCVIENQLVSRFQFASLYATRNILANKMKIIEGGILLFVVIVTASANVGTINVECPPEVARGMGVKAQSIGIKPQLFVSSSVINAENQKTGAIAGMQKPAGLGLGPEGGIAPIFSPIGDLCFPLASGRTDNRRPVVHPARAVIPIQPGQVLSFNVNPNEASLYRGKNYGGYPTSAGGHSHISPVGYCLTGTGAHGPNDYGVLGYTSTNGGSAPNSYSGSYYPHCQGHPNAYFGGYCPIGTGAGGPICYGRAYYSNSGGAGGVGNCPHCSAGCYCPSCAGLSSPGNQSPLPTSGQPQDVLVGFQKPGATAQTPEQFRPTAGAGNTPRDKFMALFRAVNPGLGGGNGRGTTGQGLLTDVDVGLTAPLLSFEDQEKLYNGIIKTTPDARADPVSISLAHKNLLGPLQNCCKGQGRRKCVAESSLYFGPKKVPADGRKEIPEKDFPEEKLHAVDKVIVELKPLEPTSARKSGWSVECDDDDVDQGEPLSKANNMLMLSDQGNGAGITYSELGYVPVGTSSDTSRNAEPGLSGSALDERDINLCQISGPPHPDFIRGDVTFELPNKNAPGSGGDCGCGCGGRRYDDDSSGTEDDEGEEGSGEDDEGLTDICQDLETLSNHRVKFGTYRRRGRLSKLWHSAQDPARFIM
ncbi:uncharacterized protein LOC135164660 [Diachasmimorpha longicaudata]|uniref:uncharacterized protein LOC135164660 n=1 Tax=Diachasmimorpha longicaudata TaxID=58733 RepID=UPI0030B895A7